MIWRTSVNSVDYRLNDVCRKTFNFAPTFCFFTPHYAAVMLGKSYWNDKFDLEELSLHGGKAIEHDASLTRQDAALVRGLVWSNVSLSPLLI